MGRVAFTWVGVGMLLLACTVAAQTNGDCLGEYQQCTGGDCVMISSDCGICKSGEYLCPDRTSCAPDAAGYMNCPGIKGTHFDWTLPLDQRLAYLVAHTNLTDQIGQLCNWAPAIPYVNIPEYNWLNDDVHSARQPHATQFPDGVGLGATWSRAAIRAGARAIASEARALHNWLVHRGDRGNEIKSTGGWGITAYGPNMNLVRDPRWGRNQEVYSEDPFLSSRLTVEMVTGYQWGPPSPTIVPTSSQYWLLAACCKHFAAYDLEDIPVDRTKFNALLDTRNMWETYMPVFKSCVWEAKAAHVMCSYNSINGVPTCADPNLLNGILREKWNFTGFVVSDFDAWANIYETHQYCPNLECAAYTGINAGMDQELGTDDQNIECHAIQYLMAAYQAGNVTAARIGEAYARLFSVRIQLGMLDPPTMVPYNLLNNDSWVEGVQHLALARTTAQQSIAMFKNQNSAGNTVLPLTNTYSNIAVIGPQAIQNDLLLGNYATYPDKGVPTILQGIQAAVQNATCNYQENVDYFQPNQTGFPLDNPGECCDVCTADPNCNYWTFYQGQCYLKATNKGEQPSAGRISGAAAPGPRKVEWATGCPTVECNVTTGFEEATQLAAQSDVVIVILGLDQNIEAEFHDRTTIDLPLNQYALVAALRQAVPSTTPFIAVFIHGGAFALRNIQSDFDAIIDAWYPGQMGGLAIGDVLFGAVSPAGRSAVTWYASDDDLPEPGNMDLYPSQGNMGITHRYFTGTPTIPFGFGLSYTNFQYSNLTFNTTGVNPCDVIQASVVVTNMGNTPWKTQADEVAQLYLTQNLNNASIPVPLKRLAGFERITLTPGQSQTVTFAVTPDYFSVVLDGTDIYNPVIQVLEGKLSFHVGGGPAGTGQGLQGTLPIVSSGNLTDCPGWVP